MHSILFPTFSSVTFHIFSFMLESLIYLKLSFLQGDKNGNIYIFLHDDINFDKHHLLKILCLFIFVCFGGVIVLAFFKNLRCPCVIGLLSVSSVWFHSSTCLFLFLDYVCYFCNCYSSIVGVVIIPAVILQF